MTCLLYHRALNLFTCVWGLIAMVTHSDGPARKFHWRGVSVVLCGRMEWWGWNDGVGTHTHAHTHAQRHTHTAPFNLIRVWSAVITNFPSKSAHRWPEDSVPRHRVCPQQEGFRSPPTPLGYWGGGPNSQRFCSNDRRSNSQYLYTEILVSVCFAFFLCLITPLVNNWGQAQRDEAFKDRLFPSFHLCQGIPPRFPRLCFALLKTDPRSARADLLQLHVDNWHGRNEDIVTL